MSETQTTLRRIKKDGSHAILETKTPSVHTSTAYAGRVSMLIGDKHILRLTKEDAAWLGDQLTKAAQKA